MNIKININPISINRCYQGRRFRTKEYEVYEKMLSYLLPRLRVPEGALRLTIHAGFSSKLSDLDNCCKPFLDCLQKKYKFNDREVYEICLRKSIVPKGKEFLEFSLESLIESSQFHTL